MAIKSTLMTLFFAYFHILSMNYCYDDSADDTLCRFPPYFSSVFAVLFAVGPFFVTQLNSFMVLHANC